MSVKRVRQNSRKREVVGKKARGGGTVARSGVVIKFTDKSAFGEFCMALADDGMPFTLAGFQTVVVHKRLEELSISSRAVFEKHVSSKTAELLPVVPRGKRHLPTTEEAQRLFREFAEKYT